MRDPKVQKSFGDGCDEYLHAIQLAKEPTVYTLNNAGLDGHLLEATIKASNPPKILVRPQTEEQLEALSVANTHNAKFMTTGGFSCDVKQFLPVRR